MCIVCGVPLELATEAPQANRSASYIRSLIAEGLTKEEIKDRLVDQYGPEVLAIPGDDGFDLAAWIVPGAAIVVAAWWDRRRPAAVAASRESPRWGRFRGTGAAGQAWIRPTRDASKPISRAMTCKGVAYRVRSCRGEVSA